MSLKTAFLMKCFTLHHHRYATAGGTKLSHSLGFYLPHHKLSKLHDYICCMKTLYRHATHFSPVVFDHMTRYRHLLARHCLKAEKTCFKNIYSGHSNLEMFFESFKPNNVKLCCTIIHEAVNSVIY